MKTNYGGKDCARAVFNKGRKIEGKDPLEWRKSAITGKPIKFSHHGKATKYGWDIEHKIPKAKNGSDHLSNLIPLDYYTNRSQGASMKNKKSIVAKFHIALAQQRGIKPTYKNLDFKWSEELIGKTLWVKETPVSIQKLAKINFYNRKIVNVTWVDTLWNDDIELNKDLFENISTLSRGTK